MGQLPPPCQNAEWVPMGVPHEGARGFPGQTARGMLRRLKQEYYHLYTNSVEVYRKQAAAAVAEVREEVYCPELWRVWILPYLQANKFACHSFMGTGRRHETAESDKGLYSIWYSRQPEFHVHVNTSFLQLPLGQHRGESKWMWHIQHEEYLRYSKLNNPQSFVWWPPANLPSLFLGRNLAFILLVLWFERVPYKIQVLPMWYD